MNRNDSRSSVSASGRKGCSPPSRVRHHRNPRHRDAGAWSQGLLTTFKSETVSTTRLPTSGRSCRKGCSPPSRVRHLRTLEPGYETVGSQGLLTTFKSETRCAARTSSPCRSRKGCSPPSRVRPQGGWPHPGGTRRSQGLLTTFKSETTQPVESDRDHSRVARVAHHLQE